ncbi:MAG: hypothetical protein LDLANPLL_02886 [Turneriella sp.]|nr:hypothetical protein [Turneriella sp.]
MVVAAHIALTRNTNIMMMKENVSIVGPALTVLVAHTAQLKNICTAQARINADTAVPAQRGQAVRIVHMGNMRSRG